MQRCHLRLVFAFAAVACGGCGNTTMSLPDMAPAAPPLYVGDKPGMAMADESCLGTRMDPAAPSTDTLVTGVIKDFENSLIVSGAVVSVYFNPTDVPNSPAVMSAPSAMDGTWSVTVPAGHYRVIFGNSGGTAISGGAMKPTIPTYEFDRVYNDHDRTSVLESTRDAIQGLVSVVPDKTLGVLAGSVRDCANKDVGGASVTITNTSSTYDTGKLLFYFVDVSGSTLPTRTQRFTSGVGVFAALNVPIGEATATATGIVGSGAPQTLGSVTVPLQPGAVTIADILPAAAK